MVMSLSKRSVSPSQHDAPTNQTFIPSLDINFTNMASIQSPIESQQHRPGHLRTYLCLEFAFITRCKPKGDRVVFGTGTTRWMQFLKIVIRSIRYDSCTVDHRRHFSCSTLTATGQKFRFCSSSTIVPWMERLDRTWMGRRPSHVNASFYSAHSIGGYTRQVPQQTTELLEVAGLVHYVSEKLKWKFSGIGRTSWVISERYLYLWRLRCGFRNLKLIRIATLKGLQVRTTTIGRERGAPVCIMLILVLIFYYS